MTVHDLFIIQRGIEVQTQSFRSALNLLYGENIEGLSPEEQDAKAEGNPGRELLLREWRNSKDLMGRFIKAEVSIPAVGDEDLKKFCR